LANEYLNNKTFESIIQSFQFHKREKERFLMTLGDYEETHKRRLSKYNDDAKKEKFDIASANYNTSCTNFKDFQNQLAYAFYILAQNITNYAKFSGIDSEDAVQEGVMICFDKIDRFDPRKGKAFNYMTTCILNHYRQLYRSARNYNELKKKYMVYLSDRFDSVITRNGRERSQNNRSYVDRDSNSW
jgi:DNA-directed RNA polymerase specialized sigma subunit